MSNGLVNLKKAFQIFGTSPESVQSELPAFTRSAADNRLLKSWSLQDLPAVGEQIGFMKRPARPLAVSLFVTKGGVLKSSLTLNFARLAALHGIHTCVVGLDMQGDITSALNFEDLNDEDVSLADALRRAGELRGLTDVFLGQSTLDQVVQKSDLPTLSYIPETPELVALDQSLVNRNRREYWLRDVVIKPLKEQFDLVIMDCSPNWNRLITNALVASDVLISPLECKINNFRNFKTFRALLQEFRSEMGTEFRQVFVPTRLIPARKLSREIHDWYHRELTECTATAIRESLQGEEATAMRVSVPEYAPTSVAADEMRQLIREVWERVTVRVPTHTVAAHPELGASL